MIRTVQVFTHVYFSSHGRKPSGTGCWAFAPRRTEDAASPDMLWSASLPYGEARRWALAEAKRRGWKFLFVMP